MGKYTPHIRIPVSLFEHPSYLGLPEGKKLQCFAVLAVLLRFADKNTGKCHPRLVLMADMLGVSRLTIYRCINLMIKNKMVIKKRLRSTNLYVINPIFMINDIKRDVSNGYIDVSNRYMDVSNGKVLIEPSNYPSNITNRILSKVDVIVNNTSLDKQSKIIKLASLTLPELKQCINKHPHYVQRAIEHQEQELRDARAVPKHIVEQAMTAVVSKNAKNRSFNYRKKIEYNKRNGLNWKGEPIKK
jgi:vacuolar-type H+-ATPase subunit H